MEEVFARLSKSGRVVCGQPGVDGRYTCDEPLAERVMVHEHGHLPERRLVALPGWVQDRKGIWVRTTRVEDLKRRGRTSGRSASEQRVYPDLPTLARCPKCRTVQWLDAEHLKVEPYPPVQPRRHSGAGRRWVIPR